MKKITFFVLAALAMASCSHETDLYEGPQTVDEGEQIRKNVQNVLGSTFDMNQDYAMLTSGVVNITADVEESEAFQGSTFEAAKVQVLDGNPFYQTDVKVLNEADVKAGESKDLCYDAPKGTTVLYAAVVSKDLRYRVVPFTVAEGKTVQVGFGTQQPATSRMRATASTTEGAAQVAVPTLIMPAKELDQMSYNHRARINGNALFKDSYWSDYKYNINATVEAVDNFSKAELKDVEGIMHAFVPEGVDNRNSIKQSEFYINTSNYFTTTQKAKPIKVTFVHSGASVIDSEMLYYYYYDPSKTVGMDDEQRTEFLESLPKYCLLNCKSTRDAGTRESSWLFTKRAFKYTLAYFGDEKRPADGTEGTYEFPSGYKIGFMLVTTNGNSVELYADTLLNNEVNKLGKWAEAKMAPNSSRAAIFGANGVNYVSFEDLKDNDFDDVVFQIEGGVEIIDESKLLDKGVYTYAFEDTKLGDYDMNDVVIKAQRQDVNHVKFSLEATGAWDELYIKSANSNLKLNKLASAEVHELFGVPTKTFVNTEDGKRVEPVQEIVEVPNNFSFAVLGRSIYIENKTQGTSIQLAEKGQDPHGILIPWDWKYPLERVCVKDAFSAFNTWGANRIDAVDWFKTPVEGKVYTQSALK